MPEPARRGVAREVGRVGDYIVEQSAAAADALAPVIAAIVSAMRSAKTAAQAVKKADKAIDAFSDDDAIGDAIFVAMAMADMAGQLAARVNASGRIELDEKSVPLLDRPWIEALEEFRARGIVTPDELSKMLATYADRSVEARALMLRRIQDEVRSKLDAAIAEGQTIGQWVDALESGKESLGITLDDPAYLETVFRTNVQSAYGAGRFRALTDPDVIAQRPYVQYRTTGDDFVRPSHALLDGKIFRADDPTWHAIAPPNGFNCRCSFVSLSQEDFDAERASVSKSVPKGAEPDPGFDGPPVRNIERPML
jgi:SPP1 gp7 family putative phage head morphogenesis protein